ncbi:MAG: nucleotidyltransferase family protein [Oscillospiraceae bacterium]|jgi:NDP-sugar pyrophosphorylase family protein
MKTSLLIMAAGIGSRYGKGIKQLAGIGPEGEIIMEYSIHDAMAAGFDKIVFVIRPEIEHDFLDILDRRVTDASARRGIELAYAFQKLSDIPFGFSVPEGRSKPWGTGQAVLSARELIDEPFAVINADDYYGKTSFVAVHSFLVSSMEPSEYCMAGYRLVNTLSDNGTVTRGVCRTDENGYLRDIEETYDIEKRDGKAFVGGRILPDDTVVSMNMWGFKPGLIQSLKEGFREYLAGPGRTDIKSEFLLPSHVGKLIRDGSVTVRVLETSEKWQGITYHDDLPAVQENFKKMYAEGIYKKELFSDIR